MRFWDGTTVAQRPGRMSRPFALVVLLLWTFPLSAQVIVLDPGHGGSDPGAVGCSLEEEDVVLDIARRTRDLLRREGLTVYMTREDDRSVGLSTRARFANDRGATRFVSIHANSNAGTPATGTETFVYTSASSASRDLGRRVQDEMLAAWGLRNRGLKSANFAVLRRTSMPASLSETAFINNCGADASRLRDPAQRQRMAEAHFRAILGSLGRAAPAAPAPGPSEPAPGRGQLRGVAFEDVGVGLEDTSRRLAGASVRVVETGAAVTADADGFWSFDVPDGTYTVEASVAGFVTSTRTCSVAGAETWCSVGLRREASAGTATGVVFEDRGAGFADTSTRLAGATVRVRETGAAVATDTRGSWRIDLPPGTYHLDVTAGSYLPAARECVVTAGAQAWCSVGLVRPARTGVLQGVVYEGDDLARRVVGARVRIVESGASDFSQEGNGFWSFDLPPGRYTVEASGEGLTTNSRTCEVAAGAETWCSVSVRSAGHGGGLETMRVEEDAAVEGEAMGGAPIYADDPGYSGATGTLSGCSAGGEGAGGASLALLVLLGLRLRRRRTLAACLGTLALVGCGTAEEPSHEPLTDEVQAPRAAIELPAELGRQVHLTDLEVVAEGDWADVTLAPTGDRVALSHPGYEGVSVAEVSGGGPRLVATGARAGYRPVWRRDGLALGLRVPGETSTAIPTRAVDLSGLRTAPVVPQSPFRVRVTETGAIALRSGPAEDLIAPPGDRYFAPQVSEDGRWVAFEGLSTGLYLHETREGRTFHLGAGSHPRFGGRYLVFERTEDDGHQVTAGDLYLVELSGEVPALTRLTSGPEVDQAPSIVGDRVAFLRDDRVVVATLR